MANNYTKILELANKNNMGLSNTIKRDYGIPLDYSSVQETYEAALAYAKTSTLAYVGQPISVGDTLYVVTDEANGYLKAVGTKPTGDNASIEVAEDGKVSIYGFTAAESSTLPRKKFDGTIEWVAIDAIVSGDGNEKTRVAVAEDSAITVTPTYDADNDTYTYTLDVTLPAIPSYSVTKTEGEGTVTYQLTKDGVAEGEAIVVPNAYDDSDLEARVAAVEGDVEDHETRLADVEDQVEAFFAAVKNPDEVIDTLAEIQKYIADDKTGAAGMLESIGALEDAVDVLNGEAEGSVKKTVDDAIAAQAEIDAGLYATQSGLAAVSAVADAAATKAEVTTALADKADKTDLDNYYNKDSSYSKEQIDALLDGITGEYGETADSVAGALNAHKAEAEGKFADINTKQGEQDTAIQANADAIEAINAATTGIYDRAVAAAAADAQNKVDALASGTVAQNTSDISAINTKVEGINENINTISGKVGALETKDAAIEAAVNAEKSAREALATTVGEHTTAITALQDKDTELGSLVAANTAKFDNYSTTTEVDQKIASAISGIDYTGLNEAIAANTKAIGDEETRAKAREDELAGLISGNTSAIESTASDLAALETALNAVLDNDDETALNSIKELAVWVEEHESEVLPDIQANTEAIAKLNGDAETEGSIQKIVADAIAAIPATPIATDLVAGIVKASEEVNVLADGTMALGVISTDKLVNGSDTLVLNGGNAAQ